MASRRGNDYSTIADQRAKDVALSRSQVARTVSSYGSEQREKDKVDKNLLGSLYSNSRCLTWGTVFPMTNVERHVHRLFSEGLGIESDPTEVPWRPIYEIASCRLGDKMIVSASIVHPAIATCTVPIGNMDGEEASLRCLDGIDIVSPPSSGSFSHRVTVDRGRRKLSGRMALRTFASGNISQEDGAEKLPTYVNMSSSCLLFQVSMSGKCWTCSPSVECLRLIRSKCGDKFSVSMANNRLMIHLWLSTASNDTHIKVSSNGSLAAVGSPSLIGGVAGVLAQVIEHVLSEREWCVELLDTLRVTSTCGSILKVS